MTTKLHKLSFIVLCCGVFCVFAISAHADDADPNTLVLKLVDESGKPVAGALAGIHADYSKERNEGNVPRIMFAANQKMMVAQSDEQGMVRVPKDHVFHYWNNATHRSSYNRPVAIVAIHKERQLIAMTQIVSTVANEPLKLVLVSGCRVKGTITCDGLKELGKTLAFTNVMVMWGENQLRPVAASSQNAEFDMLLPPGKYSLYAYGSDTYSRRIPIEIKPDQKVLEMSIEVPATHLATLIGKRAPELVKIKGWKNGEPISLSKLRGKVVILDFWGYWCGPCIASMPKLMELHDKYDDKGLVIIGVHDDSVASIEEMNDKMAGIPERRWNGRDLPFLVALDGGGPTPIPGTNMTRRGATTATYGINGFPTSVLIDKNGVIIKHFHPGGASTEADIEKLLSESYQAPASE